MAMRPRSPSTWTVAPSGMILVASGQATAGMEKSRAVMAPCDNTPPRSTTSPLIVVGRAPSNWDPSTGNCTALLPRVLRLVRSLHNPGKLSPARSPPTATIPSTPRPRQHPRQPQILNILRIDHVRMIQPLRRLPSASSASRSPLSPPANWTQIPPIHPDAKTPHRRPNSTAAPVLAPPTGSTIPSINNASSASR